MPAVEPFRAWYDALERRHTADLTFQEVRRGVQALSTAYVEKRGTHLDTVLGTAGKRAAFALFYAPLHFLTVRDILRRIRPSTSDAAPKKILDLGCGTGPAGAAWALEAGGPVPVTGIERNSWAAGEARWTYRTLGVRGTVRSIDLTRSPVVAGPETGIVAAFTINELMPRDREILRERLLEAAGKGAAVLVVEPIARRPLPWWDDWVAVFTGAGGQAGRWKFPADLPPSLRLMTKAAHLVHHQLRARSLWLPGNV